MPVEEAPLFWAGGAGEGGDVFRLCFCFEAAAGEHFCGWGWRGEGGRVGWGLGLWVFEGRGVCVRFFAFGEFVESDFRFSRSQGTNRFRNFQALYLQNLEFQIHRPKTPNPTPQTLNPKP